jgi:ATP-dependent Clp protease adapter protein ClpS
VKERDHLEDLGTDGNVTKWILKIRLNSRYQVHLSEDRCTLRTVVREVMNIGLHKKWGYDYLGKLSYDE